jgi:hypothetical protein
MSYRLEILDQRIDVLLFVGEKLHVVTAREPEMAATVLVGQFAIHANLVHAQQPRGCATHGVHLVV